MQFKFKGRPTSCSTRLVLSCVHVVPHKCCTSYHMSRVVHGDPLFDRAPPTVSIQCHARTEPHLQSPAYNVYTVDRHARLQCLYSGSSRPTEPHLQSPAYSVYTVDRHARQSPTYRAPRLQCLYSCVTPAHTHNVCHMLYKNMCDWLHIHYRLQGYTWQGTDQNKRPQCDDAQGRRHSRYITTTKTHTNGPTGRHALT